MKLRRAIKKSISLIMTFALALTLLLNVGVLEPKAANSIILINGISMEVDTGVVGSVVYYKNGDDTTSGLTGTSSDWNAKYENTSAGTRLTLKNLNLEVDGVTAIDAVHGIYSDGINLVLEGTNVITDISDTNTEPIIDTYQSNNKRLTFSGDGSLTINDLKTSAAKSIICCNLTMNNTAKVTLNVGGTGRTQWAIYATSAITLNDSASLKVN